MESRFTSKNLAIRVIWAYAIYIGLVLISFAIRLLLSAAWCIAQHPLDGIWSDGGKPRIVY